MTLTENETRLLEKIKHQQNEQGHSDYCTTDAGSKKDAGTLSSLEKKQMIYNSYANWTLEDFLDMDYKKPFKMWCLTEHGAEIVGTPEHWD